MSSLETDKLTAGCELDQNLELLRQTYLFSGIPLETLKVFAYLCSREKFQEGEYLFRQGEDDGQAFYIISGHAVLEREEGTSGDSSMPGRRIFWWVVPDGLDAASVFPEGGIGNELSCPCQGKIYTDLVPVS